MYWDMCVGRYMYFLYLRDIKCIMVIHGLMSAGVCLVAHGTEEGLIPENVLHSFCTFVQHFVTSINDISLFGLFG